MIWEQSCTSLILTLLKIIFVSNTMTSRTFAILTATLLSVMIVISGGLFSFRIVNATAEMRRSLKITSNLMCRSLKCRFSVDNPHLLQIAQARICSVDTTRV
jgi:flagellar motor component MotA